MKPWEETWEAVSAEQTGGSNEIHYGDGQVGCLQWGHDSDDLACARLAAAAPDMARLLLDAFDNAGQCIGCHHIDNDIPKHAPDCALVAVLRKAGVLE